MKQIHVLLQTLLLIIISENKYFALLLLPGKFLIVDRRYNKLLTAYMCHYRQPNPGATCFKIEDST